MKDQFADLPWYLQPGAWPYWPTPPLTGPSTTQGGPWPQGSPSTVANSSGGLLGSLVRPASGILGSLARPVEEPTAAINGPLAWGLGTMPSVFFPAQPQNIWTRGIPSQAPLGLNYPAAVHASDKLDPRDNAGGAATPNAQTPPLARPSVPLSGADNGSSSPEPALPEPPKDFRTWLLDALSDQNVRYYAGPHLYEALRKLHALTQVLPGSGTVQSTQDASRAGEEAQAGNYGKAAAHFGWALSTRRSIGCHPQNSRSLAA